MSAVTQEDRKLQNRAVLGILLMLGGLALYPLADAFVKHLMGTYSVTQVSFLRGATRILPLLVAMYFQGGPRRILATSHPGRHAVRLSVNFVYTLSFMYAFSVATLTNIYTLSYTSPFFMIILSAIMLKEQVGWQKWTALGVGLVGVVVAMRPGSSVFEMASLIVLAGTFLGALNKILMRRLASTEHSLSIAIYPNIVMILALFPLLIESWQPVTTKLLPFVTIKAWQPMPLEHWGLFAIVGAITAAGQYMIAQSLRYTQASTLAPIDYSTYFWVVLFDFAWWNKVPDSLMVAGAAIIVSSNLYILYCTRRQEARKRKEAIPTTS